MTVYPSFNDNSALAQAIADARGGRRDDAVRRLRQIVQTDPVNVDAWIWLGGTAPDVGEQRRALERALELAPDNRRAQQGLEWLRANAPHAFNAAPAAPAAPSPDQRWAREGATPRYNVVNDMAQRADAPTQAVDRSLVWNEGYAQPVRPAPHEQPTMQMPMQAVTPAAAPYQQAPPPAAPIQRAGPVVQPRPAPPLPRTETMRGAPPQARARPRRALGANIARLILLCIWCLGLGATLLITAVMILALISDQQSLDSVVRSVLSPFGLSVDFLGTAERVGMVASGVVLVLLNLAVVTGLVMSWRWAWRVAFAVAALAFVGAVVLALLPFFITIPQFNYSLSNPATQTLLGLLLSAFVLFIVTIISRNAFRHDNRYDAYGR